MDNKLLLLYRHILKAAHKFPSIKRGGIIRDIKTEFREGKRETDPQEVTRRQNLAIDSLKQLQDYAGIDGTSTDWKLSLRGGSPPPEKFT